MFKDLIIVGPTSTGKSDLANFIATNRKVPVFNCDSVQIYEGLNILTNKPDFIDEHTVDGEIVNVTKPTQFLDFNKYKDFTFKVFINRSGNLVSENFDEPKFFEKFLMDKGILINKVSKNDGVSNYLFNIREPGEDYSVPEFLSDLERITKKNSYKQKIIVGGTLYYAYSYIFNSQEVASQSHNNNFSSIKKNLNKHTLDQLIDYLQLHDPELLQAIDKSNKSRLINAVAYIESTGEKYSEVYFKEEKLLDDFVLIMIYPKNREEYCKRIDSIVEKRMNMNAINEIQNLMKNYGVEIRSWLSKVSYEYKYGLEIYDLLEGKGFNTVDLKKYKEILDALKAKERQYTKRQGTFMRKVEDKLRINRE